MNIKEIIYYFDFYNRLSQTYLYQHVGKHINLPIKMKILKNNHIKVNKAGVYMKFKIYVI